MKEFNLLFASGLAAIFSLTVAIERILIPILRSHKMGQKILDIGPRWHKSKEGTPTMGGLGFIIASLLIMVAFFAVHGIQNCLKCYIPLMLTYCLALANGLIGFFDDYRKLVKKQNEGLTWKQKLFLQLAVAIAYVVAMALTDNLPTTVNLPFSEKTLNLGWGVYPITVIVLAGVINGGNITDGIDGLASSVTFVIGAFFAVLAFTEQGDKSVMLSDGMVSAILIGSALGFLVYNFHPAKVFMGDTGSLFFGSLVIGACVMKGELIVGLIVSAVFILEMLSSLLQVVYFRLTHGKRLFKMAPVHHHFEKCGWSENKVVLVFSLVEVLFCVLAWFAIIIR